MAQINYFRHIQEEDGLSNNTVFCISEDKYGYMWFGTKDGLCRYDGKDFKVFVPDKSNPQSLQTNYIKTLYLDNYKTLWIGTNMGLYRFDYETEGFHYVTAKTQQGISIDGLIHQILMDKKDNLWVISEFTLFRYDIHRNILKSYPNVYTTSLCELENGDIWIYSSDKKIQRYNSSNESFTSYPVSFKNDKGNWVEKIAPFKDFGILIGTIDHGVLFFDTQTKECVPFIDFGNNTSAFVRCFLQYSKYEYWIGTERGIYTYNIVTKKINLLKSNFDNQYELNDNPIYDLYKDREGGIWIGTYFGGINYHSVEYENFTKYLPGYKAKELRGKAIRDIKKDQYDHLWIGTEDGGLHQFDRKNNTFININQEYSELPNNNIQALLPDGDELLVATYESGLSVLNIHTGKLIKHYPFSAGKQGPSSSIFSILKARDGTIYLGTVTGYNTFQRNTGSFESFHQIPHIVTYILEDHKGIIWFATIGGVYSLDPKNQTLNNFVSDLNNENSLSHDIVNSIFEDFEHNLWFATNNGLCSLDDLRQTFHRYDVSDGLPGNLILRIEEDPDKNLWISTSHGLSCLNTTQKVFKNYKKPNGLVSNQFNYNSSYKDDDGRLYFGTINGLISFNPENMLESDYIPPVIISSLAINDKEVKIEPDGILKKPVNETKRIVLNHNESTLSIRFSALSYVVPNMNQYAYMLEGIDDDWVYCGNQNRTSYSKLPPGKYLFKVKATNGSGYWNENPKTLEIEITPPFWQTTWAYCLYIFVGLGLFLWIFRFYKNKMKLKEKRKWEIYEREKEKEIYQTKIDFFTNVAHEIKTPLSLIKSPLDKINKMDEKNPQAKEYLAIIEKNTNRLLTLVNQLLDFRKAEKDSFNLQLTKINIVDLVSEVVFRFKPTFIDSGLSVEQDMPKEPVYAKIDKDATAKIISNLFSNALKYTQSKILVSLRKDKNENKFLLKVKNDGITIPLDLSDKIFEPFYRVAETSLKEGIGIGLSLAKSLAELQKGNLEYSIDEEHLNVFTFSMPVEEDLISSTEQEESVEIAETVETAALEKTSAKLLSEKISILVVEDHVEMNNFLSKELSEDYHVISAENGNEAVEFLKTEPIQLILTDVIMPVMDGFELIKWVKTTLEYSHIPIVVLTAKGDLQSHITGLETGADAYIEKPFEMELVSTQITALLNNRHAVKSYFSQSPLVHLKEMAHSKADENFLEKLNELICKKMGNTDLNVNLLADMMNMSRPTFYRKIKAISNTTPNEFVNIIRLRRAAELLLEGKYRINEITDIVGFNSSTYFSRLFQKQFGIKPSEYSKDIMAETEETEKPYLSAKNESV
ncbi:hybrid sensor histidine kinase/response regulator [Bacteroidia bacterium]|nr:hybrid sensor histidine kinase/response regulator [Bacteroidia bacterium]